MRKTKSVMQALAALTCAAVLGAGLSSTAALAIDGAATDALDVTVATDAVHIPIRGRQSQRWAQNQAVTPPVPRPAPPSASPLKFELLRDRAIHGKDIEVIRNSTLPDCLSSCQKTAACTAAVFDKWNQWCFIKSEAARTALDAKYSTYLRSDAAPKRSVTRAELQRYKGKAFPVAGGQQLSGLTQSACEARCDASATCTAFTHFASTNRCVLLSDPGEYTSNADATSGAKHQAN